MPLVLAALVAAGASARAQPTRYTLDPQHSFVHFEFQHFATSTSRGRLGPVAGEVVLDRKAKRGEVSVRIPMHSVDTGIPVFDARLRRSDLLDAEGHPEAWFVASQMRFDGESLAEVRGEFTLRGVSQPLSLRALKFGCREADGVQLCGGDFEGELLRSSIGATYGLPFIGDRVRILVQVEGRRR